MNWTQAEKILSNWNYVM